VSDSDRLLTRIIEQLRAAASLLVVGLPWLERIYHVLPVTERIRDAALPAAMLAALLCVIAGYATARHSMQGMHVGWTALVLFLVVLVVMFGFMDLLPRADRALYILCFALFGLSVASFLSLRREDAERTGVTSW
jgi:cytochrome bd-type quinol oxidase subunit 2